MATQIGSQDIRLGAIPRLLYANPDVPTGNTVSNTTTETNFSSLKSFAANVLRTGWVINIRAAGVLSTATGNAQLTLRLKLGSIVIANTTAKTMINNLANRGWSLDFQCIVMATGAAGSIEGQGSALMSLTSSVGDLSVVQLANATAIPIDTTQAMDLLVSAQWSAANSGNKATLRSLVAQLIC